MSSVRAQQDPLDAFKDGGQAPLFGPQPAKPGAEPFSLLSANGVPVENATARLMRHVREQLGSQHAKEAVDLLNQVLANDPQNVEALEDRAYALASLSQFPQAEKDLAAVRGLVQANDTHYYLTAVSVYSAEKKFQQGADVITAALALSPKDYKLLLTRADFYNAAKAYDKAYADATEAIGLAPDEPETYLERSAVLSNQGRTEEAVDDLSQAILLRPDDANAFSNRAILEDKIGDHRAEFADLKTALRLDPKSPVTLNGMAWYLAICYDPKQRDGARAVTLATQACEASQWKDGGIVDTLAAAQAEIGKFDEAVKNQTRAIALSAGQDDVLPEMRRRLELYQKRKPYHEAAIDPSTLEWSQVRYQTFMTVWQTVNDAYYDVTFGGVDWGKVREKYRSRLDSVANNEALRALLREMLGELHRTHFAVIPREGAVFNPSERVRIGTVGADLSFSDGSPIISTVEKGSAASTGGLRPGDQVMSVNGKALAPVAQTLTRNGVSQTRAGLYLDEYVESFLTGPVGTQVELQVKSPDGKVRPVKVTCAPNTGEWSEPIGYFPSLPIKVDAEHQADGIDYLKFNAFVPSAMKRIRAFMRTVKPTDGLIIDLRGNGGGVSLMAAGIAGLLCHHEFSMGTMHLRDGALDLDVYPQAHIFDGPVAVLIDRSSASTSEIFAAGIKESHRAQVFGETSPGMALPSLFKALPTGDLLQYAIADVTTPDGITIEGTGVTPDHPVPMSREDMAAGRDPVLDAARAWIQSERHRETLAKAP